MESAIAVTVLSKAIGAAVSIMKDRYSRWRQNKTAKAEEFREANKRLRMAISRSMVLMENTVMQLGHVRIYHARNLAESVTEIVRELDEVAEENCDVMEKEVYDATKNLARAFQKWQVELNPFRLVASTKGAGANSSIKENVKYRSYSPGEMSDLLQKYYSGLEDLE